MHRINSGALLALVVAALAVQSSAHAQQTAAQRAGGIAAAEENTQDVQTMAGELRAL